MYHLGTDVHKDESHVAVLDDDGEVDREIRVKNANIDEVAEEYESSQAAIEATSNYYTIYDTLDEYLDDSLDLFTLIHFVNTETDEMASCWKIS